jgi:hypothetical protein
LLARRCNLDLDTGVNGQHGSIDALLRHLWRSSDFDGRHPLFGESDSLEVGEVFADFVPPVGVHIESVRTWSAHVQPLEGIEVWSEVAEGDGDLEGVLKVGVSDVEPVERPGGNAGCVEDFVAAGLRGQCELEGVQAFASGSERSDALLHMRHQ